MKILVTGATGFVGSALVKELVLQKKQLICSVRKQSSELPESIDQIIIEDLNVGTDWSKSLIGVDMVIHLAARAHISKHNSLAKFRAINTDACLNLARQAAKSGVTRFVFISSIKVNGESTRDGVPFRPDDTFIPVDAYGLSKYEAEQGLLAISQETGMEFVIIRPPLVYGPGVKANFALLMRWVNIGFPLLLGAVNNKRSFLALDNLVNFIIHCIDHPRAANEVFLIADDEDLSTTDLLYKIANAANKHIYLVPIPVCLMKTVAMLSGRKNIAERLFGSLQLDSSKARILLNWVSVVSMEQQLKKMI